MFKLKLMSKTAKAPTRATSGSVAFDCYADLGGEGLEVHLRPGERHLVNLGFAISLPNDRAAILAPRSGLGSKGLILSNTIGVIDQDYRQEVMAMVWNAHSFSHQVIKHGDRICQMMISVVDTSGFELADELDTTDRIGGFGSTGTK